MENPNNKYDFIKLLTFYHDKHFPAGHDGKLLCKCASLKVLKERRKVGIYGKAGEPFGTNYFNQTMKNFAKHCDFENPEKYTARSGRVGGITDLVSSKENVPSNILLEVLCHKSDLTNSLYQRNNVQQQDKRIRAVHNSLVINDEQKLPATPLTTKTPAPAPTSTPQPTPPQPFVPTRILSHPITSTVPAPMEVPEPSVIQSTPPIATAAPVAIIGIPVTKKKKEIQ